MAEPPLRILMLHGFRQTAGGFYGRSHAFRKTLRHLAKFDFLEGTFDIEPREHETLGNPGDRVKCTSAGNEMVDDSTPSNEDDEGSPSPWTHQSAPAAKAREGSERSEGEMPRSVRKCWWKEIKMHDGAILCDGTSLSRQRAAPCDL
jgi:hypothetical protein